MSRSYSYLLGVYLGDGYLVRSPKNVWRLRIFQTASYAELIQLCVQAVKDVSGHSTGLLTRGGCTEIYSYWKHWICLFPQHGVGVKHLRKIELQPWQEAIVRRFPKPFLAGLVHSDGCRVINVVYRQLKDGPARYEYPRYHFTNASEDIRGLFAEACELIGVDCRPNNVRHLSVAKRHSVAILDSFIGAKR